MWVGPLPSTHRPEDSSIMAYGHQGNAGLPRIANTHSLFVSMIPSCTATVIYALSVLLIAVWLSFGLDVRDCLMAHPE